MVTKRHLIDCGFIVGDRMVFLRIAEIDRGDPSTHYD